MMKKNKIKQSIFLSALLLLPVLVYLFLQAFGENSYDLPVRYAKDSLITQTDCGSVKVASLLLDDSAAQLQINGQLAGQINLMAYGVQQPEQQAALLLELKDALKKYPKVGYWLMTEEQGVTPEGIHTILGNATTLAQVFKCRFALEPQGDWTSTIVLMDSAGDLRGFFDSKKMEEMDRLKQEVSILYSQY
ncbi:hypothetical protein [Persicobacter psychrovividus]|uniref:Uncharacterized protein n=1 Tax=Persicobacter psychrovividus TaxID=387638 RepID=A0ABN6LEF7_9BACT|nr:hypothetical protein PEPS_20720 [Persicobacter psychrovividus]